MVVVATVVRTQVAMGSYVNDRYATNNVGVWMTGVAGANAGNGDMVD